MEAQIVTDMITGLKEAGINFVASLTCTGVKHFLPRIVDDPHFIHLPVANEGDGMSSCAGAWLGGKKPALFIEGAGFILGAHALMVQMHDFGGFPMLLIIDHRGDFGDGAAYFYLGQGLQVPRILESFQIPYSIVRESNKLRSEVVRGWRTAEGFGRPAAILLSMEELWQLK